MLKELEVKPLCPTLEPSSSGDGSACIPSAGKTILARGLFVQRQHLSDMSFQQTNGPIEPKFAPLCLYYKRAGV